MILLRIKNLIYNKSNIITNGNMRCFKDKIWISLKDNRLIE